MRILVTCSGFPPAYEGGGPIRSIEAMLSQAEPGHESFVLTNNYDSGSSAALVDSGDRWVAREDCDVLYLNPGYRSLLRGLRRTLKLSPDVIYLNSLFSLRTSVAFQVLFRLRVSPPLAIAPRGELDPGALAIRSGKKRFYLKCASVFGFFDDVIWHASSQTEADNIRQSVPSAGRIVVKENDTKLPFAASRPPVDYGLEESARYSTSVRNPLNAVFFSRLSKKKGLDVVLRALGSVNAFVNLDVIGPEEDARYVSYCREIARELPERIKVRFLGSIDPAESREILSGYDLKLLPTAAENFGHVIAESLSVGLPVMCSDNTPWSSILRSGGGVVVPTTDPHDWALEIDRYAARGIDLRMSGRLSAASAYDGWRATTVGPHFFDLLEACLRGSSDTQDS